MATELTDRQKFYKQLHFSCKLSYFCKQKYGSCKHILAVYICLAKRKKLKIMIYFLNIGYHGNQTIRHSVISPKRAYSQQNISLKQRIKLIIYALLCNQHLIINTKIKFTNESSQFMLPWQPKHNIISDFTKMAYSAKRAYSKQYISFKHYIV